MNQDIKILDKLLNSKLFLGKYPMINTVWVSKYGSGIDIVLSINENTKKYWELKDEIKSYIREISKLASVNSDFRIYP